MNKWEVESEINILKQEAKLHDRVLAALLKKLNLDVEYVPEMEATIKLIPLEKESKND